MTQNNDTLLLDYAAGNLPAPLALAVATHRALNAQADTSIRTYEDMGGEVLDKMTDVCAMKEDALDQCFARLDRARPDATRRSILHAPLVVDGVVLPSVLSRYMREQNIDTTWHSVAQGIRSMDLGQEGATRIQLLKIAPRTATPDHGHRGTEITIILDGAFDDQGKRYTCGDMIIEDENSVHAPVADPQMGCMCLVVTTAPIRLTGLLGVLVNPFLR